MSASTTGVEEPLPIGETMSSLGRLWADRIVPLTVAAAVGAVPGSVAIQVANYFLQGRMQSFTRMARPGTTPDPSQVFDMMGDLFVVYALILGALFFHMLCVYAAQTVVTKGALDWAEGKHSSLGDMTRTALPRLPSVLGVVILRSLLQVAAMIPLFALLMVMVIGLGGLAGLAGGDSGGTAAAAGFGAVCGMFGVVILGWVVGIYLSAVFMAAEPAAVHERKGPIAAMTRSAALTRGHRARIYVLILALGVAFIVLSCVLGMFSSLVTIATGGLDMATGMARQPSMAALVVGILVNIGMYTVQSLIFAPLSAVIYARRAGLSAQVDARQVAEVFA